MKLINKTLLLLTASATILASCNKFDDLNTNPDAATKVTAPMLATKLILNITQQGSAKNFVYHSMLSKQIASVGEMLRMNNTICLVGQILTAIPFLQTVRRWSMQPMREIKIRMQLWLSL